VSPDHNSGPNYELRFSRTPVLRARLANVTMAETLVIIGRFVIARVPRLIVTANVDHLMLLEKDPAFREVYERADLVTCDSIPLRWACAFLGRPVKERVAGADLFYTIAAHAAEKGWRLFYLGAADGVAEKAAAVMTARYPQLKIVGTYAPPVMTLEELIKDDETFRRVSTATPDILLVAFGAPKQELWLDAMRDKLRIPVGIGVGAAFDFAAGTVKRAPRWVQNIGLEWLHRLFQEPRRLWRRYLLGDAKFAFYVLREKWGNRKDYEATGEKPANGKTNVK